MVSPSNAAKPAVGEAPRLPATDRGRRTRSSIVNAAADLMYRQGVSATSIDQVLAKSGTGKSQLYHYFTGKDELVQAVVALQIERVLGAQPRLFTIQTWDDFVAWTRDLLAIHEGPDGPQQCPLGTLAAEIDRDPILRPAVAQAFQQWINPLEAVFTTLRDNGDIPADTDARALAQRTMVVLQGGMLMARTFGDASFLAQSIDQLLAAIRPPS